MDNTGARNDTAIPRDPMTIEEFLAFADAQPDGEKWELIEGIAVLSPSPSDFHQIIVKNVIFALELWCLEHDASWIVLPGVGTRVPVSPNSLPVPDVMVKEDEPTGAHVSNDGLVLFEVLSPSNRKKDRDWRLSVYSSVPNCRHYVTIEQKRVEAVVRDRESGWKARTFKSLDDVVQLSALGDLSIGLVDVYRRTPLGQARKAHTSRPER